MVMSDSTCVVLRCGATATPRAAARIDGHLTAHAGPLDARIVCRNFYQLFSPHLFIQVSASGRASVCSACLEWFAMRHHCGSSQSLRLFTRADRARVRAAYS
jgi:hypothetical protein